jgi:hypothetical protein
MYGFSGVCWGREGGREGRRERLWSRDAWRLNADIN